MDRCLLVLPVTQGCAFIHNLTIFQPFPNHCAASESIHQFYRRIFVWRVERIPGVDYWRIFPHANEKGPLRGGVTYRPISGLNGWLLYVSVASIDETMTLVQELGGSIVRTTGSRSI